MTLPDEPPSPALAAELARLRARYQWQQHANPLALLGGGVVFGVASGMEQNVLREALAQSALIAAITLTVVPLNYVPSLKWRRFSRIVGLCAAVCVLPLSPMLYLGLQRVGWIGKSGEFGIWPILAVIAISVLAWPIMAANRNDEAIAELQLRLPAAKVEDGLPEHDLQPWDEGNKP